MNVNELAAALLAVLEGCHLEAYPDSGGLLTIGIGHTGPEVVPGLKIDSRMAAQLFAEDQAPLLAMVKDKPILEAAALISFGFNCGRGALAKVLAGTDTIDNPKHTTDRSGHVRSGLVSRRNLELTLIRLSRGQEI